MKGNQPVRGMKSVVRLVSLFSIAFAMHWVYLARPGEQLLLADGLATLLLALLILRFLPFRRKDLFLNSVAFMAWVCLTWSLAFASAMLLSDPNRGEDISWTIITAATFIVTPVFGIGAFALLLYLAGLLIPADRRWQ